MQSYFPLTPLYIPIQWASIVYSRYTRAVHLLNTPYSQNFKNPQQPIDLYLLFYFSSFLTLMKF